jgi:hypothetical protein
MTSSKSNEIAQTSPWILWAMLCIFLNLEIGGGFYGSTLCLTWIFGLWIINDLRNRGAKTGLALLVIILVTALGAAGLLWNSSKELRVYEELGKVLLVILGTLSLKELPERIYQSLVFWIPIGLAGMAALTFLSGNGNEYDLLRFSIPSMGSSNSTAYGLVIGLLMAHFSWENTQNQLKKITIVTVGSVLLVALIATVSRGGLFQYLLGFLAFTNRKKLFLFGIFFTILGVFLWVPNILELLTTFSRLIDFQELQGNARMGIWTSLVRELLASPWHLMVGFGPGSIWVRQMNMVTHMQNSAHSLYVEIFYSFGMIGGSILLWWLWRTSQRILQSPASDSWRKLRFGLLITIVVGGLMDSYLFTAQLLWLSCLTLAILESQRIHDPETVEF